MKEQLVQLIGAYASAVKTDNVILQNLAANQVNEFLATVDVTPIAAPENADNETPSTSPEPDSN